MRSPALNSLERWRDHGLLVFRVAAGGALLFFGTAQLAAGRRAWIEIGAGVGALPPDAALGLGLLVALLLAVGGALLVLGMWTRLAALAMAALAAGTALVRWPAVRDGTFAHAAEFFYPATMAAAFWLLATLGGGRFGLDGVYRARQKRQRRRGAP